MAKQCSAIEKQQKQQSKKQNIKAKPLTYFESNHNAVFVEASLDIGQAISDEFVILNVVQEFGQN